MNKELPADDQTNRTTGDPQTCAARHDEMTMHSARLAIVPSLRNRVRSYYHWASERKRNPFDSLELPRVFAIGQHGEVEQGNHSPSVPRGPRVINKRGRPRRNDKIQRDYRRMLYECRVSDVTRTSLTDRVPDSVENIHVAGARQGNEK